MLYFYLHYLWLLSYFFWSVKEIAISEFYHFSKNPRAFEYFFWLTYTVYVIL